MTKLFVICGHGDGDSGACGNGYQEAERVRVLGARIKTLGGDNVLLGDINQNYYESAGINRLTISKDYQIIELHMDSDKPSARGGHVIIHKSFNPDSYDIALAKFISKLLPGRASSIVGRVDLANPNRAKAKGYAYRLIECGFISNATDVSIFNKNIDNIAKGILNCFGIQVKGNNDKSEVDKPTTDKPTNKPSTNNSSIKVGDRVGVKVGVKDYNGSQAAGVTRGKVCYRVDELKGDRAVLDLNGICTPFHVKDLFKESGSSKPSINNSSIKVGDRVGVKVGVKDYNGSQAGGVIRGKICYKVDELKGDRAVLDLNGICTPFHIKDLFK